mmetsp:Transcript_921/g.3128  ORF Transcript_921/g.3128 Transcript_921/m.3128 type:complete len:308 (+) Transcript_921:30-953(+)
MFLLVSVVFCVVRGESLWTSSFLATKVAKLSQGPSALAVEEETKSSDSTEATLAEVLSLIDERDTRWSPVVREGRCKVWRRISEQRHACILAKGVIDAPASDVYELFRDSAKAKDFNEYCDECVDVGRLDANVKVSWSATKKIGVFKPRDFVTLCHFTKLADGSRCVVNRAVDGFKEPSHKYQRGEIVIAANIVKALPNGKSHLTLLTQVNPRGAVDTPLGAKIANHLVKTSPVQFFDHIERAALRLNGNNAEQRRTISIGGVGRLYFPPTTGAGWGLIKNTAFGFGGGRPADSESSATPPPAGVLA